MPAADIFEKLDLRRPSAPEFIDERAEETRPLERDELGAS